jgi:hypothetical protein
MAVSDSRTDEQDGATARQYYLPASNPRSETSYVERVLTSLFRRRGKGLRVVVRKQ